MEHEDNKRALELEHEIEREEDKLQELTHELKDHRPRRGFGPQLRYRRTRARVRKLLHREAL